jgi:hypothetical protein
MSYLNYLQYDESGRVLCTGSAPVSANLSDLGLVITSDEPFSVDFSEEYIQDGEIIRRPQSPSPHHEWDWVTKSWLPNLDAARESQRQAWNAWCDRELIAGYTHNGHVFHSDDRFIAELQLILKGYERGHLTGTSAIRTLDNAVLQMTHAEIESLLLLIGLRRQAIYAQSWAGKDALGDLTTLEDIVAGGPPTLE